MHLSTGDVFSVNRYYSHSGHVVAVRSTDGKLNWMTADKNDTGQLAIDSDTQTVQRRLITAAIRVDTAMPGDEPMLWLPDAVAGAVAADRYGRPEYLALIGPVQHVEISTL